MPRNDVRFEIFYDGAWHDLVIADYVLANQAITIMRGDGAESAAVRPATVAAQLNNDDDLFRVSNPMSPLYGKIGRNIPLRVKVNDVTRAHVLASSWSSGESASYRARDDRAGRPKTGTAFVDVEGGGLLQQIGQWKDTLQSAIVRDTERLTDDLVGFWPLEDPSGSTTASSGISGGKPARASGSVSFGDGDCPGGAASAVTMGADGQLDGTFNSTSATGYQITFAMKISASMSGTLLQLFNWYDSAGRRYSWEVNDTDYAWHIRNADTDATITYVSINRGAVDASRWVRCRAKVTASGGTVTVELSWYEEGESGGLNTSFTYAGSSAGSLRYWKVLASTYTDGASFSAVTGVNDTTIEMSTGAVRNAFNGHAGETPSARFARLMGEKGLAYAITGSASTTRMGAQRPDTMMELLREIRDTEDGLLFDTRGAASVTLMTREARYNRTSVRIDVTELPRRPREITDDLGVFNIVTVKQRDGGEAIAVDSTSPVGSADSPAGIGPYEQTVNINVDDEADLPRYAAWWLARGTVALPRYPAVEVNLAALTAARGAEIAALDVGDVIELTGYRENPIRLIILGYTEVIDWPIGRTITFVTVPDQQFVVGVYDDDDSRYDSGSTTVASPGVAAGVTSIPISTTIASEVWSTTALPYDWNIGGERIRVTGMTSASGSGPYTQTATVVRAVNGVNKSLPAGTSVRLFTPARYAL